MRLLLRDNDNRRQHAMKSRTHADSGKATRRRFLASALALFTPALNAAADLALTPRQSTGPFYPATLPLDRDNDLVQVSGRSGLAAGVLTHLSGRVSDERGHIFAGALVEIWQCNAYGRYHHPGDRRHAPLDENFQGYGRFTTGDDGRYRFRTIRPVPYPGRTPHIHFAVSAPGIETLVTQMYVAGEPGNRRDAVLNSIRDERARARLIVPLLPAPGAAHELQGHFDIVLSSGGGFALAEPARLEALRRSV